MNLEKYLNLLDSELDSALATHDGLTEFYGMMQYHMGWLDQNLNPVPAARGKRLRPVLCLLSCEAVGGQVEQALPAATAIELVHNFSLIHDDIEDNSATRRHRATVWKLWGANHGINSGDAMLAIAFFEQSQSIKHNVSPLRTTIAQGIFAQTVLRLAEGQYLDMSFEDRMDVTIEQYLDMIRNKTAALIKCATHLGALVGGAEPETMQHYALLGENLGLAFQVIDDILGIWGDQAQTGKSTATDILTRKKTLPILYALQDKELQKLYAQETPDVAQVLEILKRNKAREFADQMARDYSEKAMQHLEAVKNDTPAYLSIRELALSLLKRTF